MLNKTIKSGYSMSQNTANLDIARRRKFEGVRVAKRGGASRKPKNKPLHRKEL